MLNFLKLAEDAERITSKAREMNKANNDNEGEKAAEKKFDHEKYVEINGEKLERKMRYVVEFELNGEHHSGENTPADFLERYGVEYELGNCHQLKFIPL